MNRKKSFAITVAELKEILNSFDDSLLVSMDYHPDEQEMRLYVHYEAIVIQKELKDEFYYKEI